MRRAALFLLGALLAAPTLAQTRVEVCFNHACASRSVVRFADATLEPLSARLARARDAVEERNQLAAVIGALYAEAGRQTPIFADRAGNLLDEGVYGRMDSTDHSSTTTAFLEMLAQRGWLRFHVLRAPAERPSMMYFVHKSAVIQEKGGARHAVDSWFVDPGKAVVVLPLERWSRGEGPDVQ